MQLRPPVNLIILLLASYADAVSDQAWEASITYAVTGGVISRSPLGQTQGGKVVAGAYYASAALALALSGTAKLVKAGATPHTAWTRLKG